MNIRPSLIQKMTLSREGLKPARVDAMPKLITREKAKVDASRTTNRASVRKARKTADAAVNQDMNDSRFGRHLGDWSVTPQGLPQNADALAALLSARGYDPAIAAVLAENPDKAHSLPECVFSVGSSDDLAELVDGMVDALANDEGQAVSNLRHWDQPAVYVSQNRLGQWSSVNLHGAYKRHWVMVGNAWERANSYLDTAGFERHCNRAAEHFRYFGIEWTYDAKNKRARGRTAAFKALSEEGQYVSTGAVDRKREALVKRVKQGRDKLATLRANAARWAKGQQ